MPARLLVAAILFTSAAAGRSAEIPPPVLEAVPPSGMTKIVLVAGPKLTKTKTEGEHAYLPGCRVLAGLLAQTPGVFPVLVDGGWPTKPETFAGAKAILFFGDGGGVQPMLKGDNLSTIGKLPTPGWGWSACTRTPTTRRISATAPGVGSAAATSRSTRCGRIG